MRFRQVHLDFHTSEIISDVGGKFEPKQFQECLKEGYVNSITLFAKCHHGYSYYPSKVNEIHPGLKFDLLGNMIEAASLIGVGSQIYISVGIDEKTAKSKPEWLIRDQNQRMNWTPDFNQPGFHELCLNTPYLDKLLEQIKEILTIYKPKGIFLDIVGVRECYCEYCIDKANKFNINKNNPKQMMEIWKDTYHDYLIKVAKIINETSESTEVFHNSGHFIRGQRELWSHNSHYELESLPTGGWGYYHFPMSARYIQQFNVDFLGMTGKFHTTWGEFGGFKHYNALRYEMSINLMNGSKCSVGDQLHPNGEMDKATYKLIGKAYKEVENKEPWCEDVSSIADIAILSAESMEDISVINEFNNKSDLGITSMLLEEHFLFDLVDSKSDFNKYKLIILPDTVRLDELTAKKLTKFIRDGGKILASGKSGLAIDRDDFIIDLNIHYETLNEFSPVFIRPDFNLNSIKRSSYVVYEESYSVEAKSSDISGLLERPYANRTVDAFNSHQHFPNSNISLSPGIVFGANTCYVAWNIFREYATVGSYVQREIISSIIDKMLNGTKTVNTILSPQANISLMHQESKQRLVLHIVYGSPVSRGENISVIEDIIPIYDVEISLKTDKKVNSVYLAPSKENINYEFLNGSLNFLVPKVDCHQMVVINYD